MIRVRCVKVDGVVSLEAAGHAPTDVCCGTSMIMQSAALGLRDLAKQFPRHVSFEAYQGDVDKWTDAIDSTDMRKKRRA